MAVVCSLFLTSNSSFAQGTAFTYQGRLNDSGTPANGSYDLTFALFNALSGPSQEGTTLTNAAVSVNNGLFSVTLDFGANFTGAGRWLQIGVRTNGSAGTFIPLNPRQALTPSPYAIHAGTAANVVSGSVVKRLNNLKDNVTLAAGDNVTITPSGNTITVAATGAGGSGIWSVNGTNAFYNAGSVGIGTNAPAAGIRLEVLGATHLKPGNGAIQFGSPSGELGMSLIPTAGNRADLRFDGSTLKLVATSGVGPPLPVNGLAITTEGNVGIGTGSPVAGYRLAVDGATLLRPGNGMVQFGSPGGELGMSLIPNAGNRADLRFDGSVLKLAATVGQSPPSATNGIAITTAGNVGIGTATPVAKLHAETSLANTTAVYGNATGAGGVAVYGRNPSGTAVFADGNAVQARDKGGFVKAMAYIDPFLPADQYVVRCYNSQQAGNTVSTAPCGITVTRVGAGIYEINFGFKVDDRFLGITLVNVSGVNVSFAPGSSSNSVVIDTRYSSDGLDYVDARFHILVY